MSLTDAAIRKAKPADKPIRIFDGGGLYIEIAPSGGKLWRLKYRFGGKEKRLAIGTYPEISLADARNRREEARKALANGGDPGEMKKAQKAERLVRAEHSFQAVAEEWLALKRKTWAKITADKAETHFRQYVFPQIGGRPVVELTAADFLMMLRKIADRIPYTATRLREQCAQVCRYAIATGRAASNPIADLRGALATPVITHRPAITDRREFATFLRDFRAASMGPITRAAARFALLTFVRSGEFRFAKWEEIDWKAAEWRVPARRMKMGKNLQAHIVPLARQTIELLRGLEDLTGGAPYLFPNAHGADGVISENTVGKALNDMGYQGRQCAHGFRATARSLLAEQGWSVAAMERQLDHAERSRIVAAYARAEHLDERRLMMQAWADMIDALESGADVIPIRGAKPRIS